MIIKNMKRSLKDALRKPASMIVIGGLAAYGILNIAQDIKNRPPTRECTTYAPGEGKIYEGGELKELHEKCIAKEIDGSTITFYKATTEPENPEEEGLVCVVEKREPLTEEYFKSTRNTTITNRGCDQKTEHRSIDVTYSLGEQFVPKSRTQDFRSENEEKFIAEIDPEYQKLKRQARGKK